MLLKLLDEWEVEELFLRIAPTGTLTPAAALNSDCVARCEILYYSWCRSVTVCSFSLTFVTREVDYSLQSYVELKR